MFSKTIQPTAELYAAARAGNLEDVKNILEKYKSQGLKPDRGTLLAAIKSGNVTLVQYFNKEHGSIPKCGLMEAFDEAKSLEMAKYLVKEFPALLHSADHHLTWAAARTGDVECLKFVLQVGRPWIRADSGTLCDAVRGGSLDMVRLLVEEHSLTDIDEALEFAKSRNNQEIVVYLQSKLEEKPRNSL